MLTQKYDDPTYLRESWILYGIGVAFIFLRWIVRMRTVGLYGFQGDDYLSVVVLACFTSDAAAVQLIQTHGSNVDYTEPEMSAMTDRERRLVVYGSKLQLLCWYTYPTLMWSLKGCMLFFFQRITLGLRLQRVVKWMAYVCGISYVIIIIVTTFSCWPFAENWATLPYPRAICSTRFQDMYMVTILNVLTDGAMLSIPLPLLWQLQVPLKRKLALGVMLMGGIFVIVAAIVRICMSLEAEPSTMNINRWGIRETIAGILAVNAPIVRPMISKGFWTGGTLSASGPSQPDPNTAIGKPKFRDYFRSGRRSADIFEMLDPPTRPPYNPDTKGTGTNTTIKAWGSDADSEREVSDTASEDLIIQKHGGGQQQQQQRRQCESDADVERGMTDPQRRSMERHGGINVTTTYSVRPASSTDGQQAVPAFITSHVPEMPAELDGSGAGRR